jgi:uncharacterized membrane protein SirB2
MIKLLHLLCVISSLISFVGRVVLTEMQSLVLKKKTLKVVPHVIDTLLLMTGIALVIQGHWFSGEHTWLVAKLLALLAYIGLGILAMRIRGHTRWFAFVGAMMCFIYMGIVAVSKNALFFLWQL